MKFSIIIPIYKVELYLKDCIESVIRQDFHDWELVLVDDGSPDKCPEICDNYANNDSRIKVVHKQNGGLVSARKAGLEQANGDYAICLDGDDFLSQNCLRKINDIINDFHPEVVCYGYYNYYNGKKRDVPIRDFRYGFYNKSKIEEEILGKMIYPNMGNRMPPVIWSKAYKMSLYRSFQMNVSSEISMGEDGACTYPLICNSESLYIMPDCLYYYRQVNSSMTKTKRPLSWENYDKVFDCYKQGMGNYYEALKEQLWRHRTHNLFIICVSQFYSKRHSLIETIRLIEREFHNHPEYDLAIKMSDFKSMRMRLAKFVLKHKLYPALYLYSKL